VAANLTGKLARPATRQARGLPKRTARSLAAMSDGPGGTIEVERKFSVAHDFTMPDLSGVAPITGPRTYHLTALYYDTERFRLATAHITLRRRTGGTDAGWHLKLPAGADRREIHAPLSAGTDTVPAELAGLVSGVTGGLPLRPIARLATERTVRHLIDATGQVLAEVADDRVTGSLPAPEEATWRVASEWREVEVELGSGTPDLLGAVGRLLLAAGAEPSPAASKLSLLLTAAGRLPAEAGASTQAGTDRRSPSPG
jgi:inorganic triphosphatase YgiF